MAENENLEQAKESSIEGSDSVHVPQTSFDFLTTNSDQRNSGNKHVGFSFVAQVASQDRTIVIDDSSMHNSSDSRE